MVKNPGKIGEKQPLWKKGSENKCAPKMDKLVLLFPSVPQDWKKRWRRHRQTTLATTSDRKLNSFWETSHWNASKTCTGRMEWMAHRKWKEAKQLPGTAGPGNMLGCSLICFHFLWAIHPIRPVESRLTTERDQGAVGRCRRCRWQWRRRRGRRVIFSICRSRSCRLRLSCYKTRFNQI